MANMHDGPAALKALHDDICREAADGHDGCGTRLAGSLPASTRGVVFVVFNNDGKGGLLNLDS